jgi:hypothetical protein
MAYGGPYSVTPEKPTPINQASITKALAGLRRIPFYPADGEEWLAETLAEMCRYEHELFWLVREARKRWKEWQSDRALRILFCTQFRPHDGIDPRRVGDDGTIVPLPPPLCPEDQAKVLSQGVPLLALPDPRDTNVSENEKLTTGIRRLAAAKKLR